MFCTQAILCSSHFTTCDLCPAPWSLKPIMAFGAPHASPLVNCDLRPGRTVLATLHHVCSVVCTQAFLCCAHFTRVICVLHLCCSSQLRHFVHFTLHFMPLATCVQAVLCSSHFTSCDLCFAPRPFCSPRVCCVLHPRRWCQLRRRVSDCDLHSSHPVLATLHHV